MLLDTSMMLSWFLVACNYIKPENCFEAGTRGNNVMHRQVIENMSGTINESGTVSIKEGRKFNNGLKDAQCRAEILDKVIGRNRCQRERTSAPAENAEAHERVMRVRGKLANHEDEIITMQYECRLMEVFTQDLDKKADMLKRFGQVDHPGKSVQQVVKKVKRYRCYVMDLIRTRLYELAGSTEITMESKPEKKGLRVLKRTELALWWAKRTGSQKPKKPQSRLLRGDLLELILSKNKAARDRELLELFNSITFPYKKDCWDEIRQIKICYEKCIFQMIQVLYISKSIDDDTLIAFFSSPNLLQRTALHIYDLFQSRTGGFENYHAFKPDVGFICSHWKTEHLHAALEGIFSSPKGKEYQACIIYTALRKTVQAFIDPTNHESELPEEHQEEEHMFYFFINPNFLESLKNWPTQGFDHLKFSINEMIIHLETPPVFPFSQSVLRVKRIHYLLVYYILNFVKTFYENYQLEEHFQTRDTIEFELFKKLMELFSTGLAFHECINTFFDYTYILSYYKEDTNGIPRMVSNEAKENVKKKAEDLGSQYKKLLDVTLKMSRENHLTNWWHRGGTSSLSILNFFHITSKTLGTYTWGYNRNLWLISRDPHVRHNGQTEDDQNKLLNFFLKNYNLPLALKIVVSEKQNLAFLLQPFCSKCTYNKES